MNKAVFIKSIDRSKQEREPGMALGEAAVYRLEPPVRNGDEYHQYVYLSTAEVLFEWETYAFPCDHDGENIIYRDLEGSSKGKVPHEEVLRNMGYELVGDRAAAKEDDTPESGIALTSKDFLDDRAEFFKAMAFESDRRVKELEAKVKDLESRIEAADKQLSMLRSINTDWHFESINYKVLAEARAALKEAVKK